MIVNFAGNTAVLDREKDVLDGGATNRLYSYWFVTNGECQEKATNWVFEEMRRNGKMDNLRIFLDSGAFSAWSMGVPIDVQDYIKYIKEHEDLIEIYANLDVIGGLKKTGSKSEKLRPGKETARATLKNQKIMEAAGLKPIPVFHFGEPFSYLEHYMKGYDYIALGVAGNSGSKIVPWLDECFSDHICDARGMPKVKIHGFAVTSLKVMLRYPFFSTDSTSWIMTSRMGKIYMPKRSGNKWQYDENSWKIGVSSRSPAKKFKGQHVDTLSVEERKIFDMYLLEKGFILGKSIFHREKPGYSLDASDRWHGKARTDGSRLVETIIEPGISNEYRLRDRLNIIYYLDLQRNMPEWPWAFKGGRRGFF